MALKKLPCSLREQHSEVADLLAMVPGTAEVIEIVRELFRTGHQTVSMQEVARRMGRRATRSKDRLIQRPTDAVWLWAAELGLGTPYKSALGTLAIRRTWYSAMTDSRPNG